MSRMLLVVVCSLIISGCAVSGSVGTATIQAEGDEITVQGREWGGTVACGAGNPGGPACERIP